MLYRKTPLQSPRLLLRIVAGASVTAILGAAGCGSDDSSSVTGVIDGGSTADAHVSTGPCGGGPCGSAAMPSADAGSTPDAGEDASGSPPPSDASPEATMVMTTGVLPFQPDAQGPCGGGPCGVMVMLHDGGAD